MIKLTKFTMLLLALCTTTVFGAEKAMEEKPDATFDLSAGSFAAGIGVSWGKGTLHYKGKDYPIKVNGMSLGKVGMTKASARGNLYNMKHLGDFDGNYTSTGAGMTLAGGRSAVAMKNQHGVKAAVYSTTKGLDVTAGGAGVEMKIVK